MSPFSSDLILARLHLLHPKVIDLSLGRILGLLAALDHPERRLPPVVHIAGTNGKGSVLAMLDAILAAAGRRVQRYVSPHLVRFNERILLGGTPIDEPELAAVLDRAEAANGGAPITFFEITTAAAMLAFAERPADHLLLETGLGGRLDATNVVDRPQLTALTPVSMDHESYLGPRLEDIAFEKAGILKPGVPCLLGPQRPEALAVIEARAGALDVPLIRHGRDFAAQEEDGRLRLEDGEVSLSLPLPALAGRHQIDNAALALALARRLGVDDPASLAAGLQTVRWPARLQRLGRGPLVEALPEGSELWLDGGHNPGAGEALARSLAPPLDLVVGMLATKDARGFLAPLAPLTRSLTAVPVPDEAASQDPAVLVEAARDLGIEARAAKDVGNAIDTLRSPVRVLICGSLYLAGHVLRDNG
jgi:dihydrofolate synthase / folylpolyglutamate synthase